MSTPDGPSPDAPAPEPHRVHPAVIATAIALPVALVAGIVVAAVLVSGDDDTPVDTGPVAVSGAVPAPHADSPECSALLAALPRTLGDYERAELAEPAPAGAAAWRLDAEHQRAAAEDSAASGAGAPAADPIVLRCGLDRPDGFRQGVGIQQVDAVQWFEVSGQATGMNATTWFAVDRPVYIALTLPDGTGASPIQEVSAAVAEALPARPIDPAPAQAGD